MFGPGFERLLAQARRADEAAWTALYLDVVPVLRGYLVGRGCRSADDVVSETMLQVVRDLHRFDGDERSFRSWVFAIAHHRMVDAVRYDQARPADPADDEVLQRHGATASVEEPAIARLGSSEVEHLLAAATPEQREVLLLRYVADLTLHEVAAVLGKEYNAVKALHRRAMGALREQATSTEYPARASGALTSSR